MSIDLSLDRLKALTIHLPPYTRPTIHIAGTNGKGSVSAILASILLASSLRVGRYNSPHLTTVLDCIAIDGAPVPRAEYERTRGEVEQADRTHGTRLSSFELLTMTALQIFERARVDIVVLEVGMGGRLDATNIIPTEAVRASALTAVALDHQAFLGDTVAQIAKEKAGIARAGRPFVVGRQTHAEVHEVVARVVQEAGGRVVPTIAVQRDEDVPAPAFSLLSDQTQLYPGQQNIIAHIPYFSAFPPIRTPFPLHGDHQLDNLGTALAVINALLEEEQDQARPPDPDLRARITQCTIEEGIRSVAWPGRLSFHTLPVPAAGTALLVLADGAHNRASAETLAAYIGALLDSTSTCAAAATGAGAPLPPTPTPTIPITLILALSHSPPKTPQETLAPLLRTLLAPRSPAVSLGVALLPFTPPEGMPWVRPVPGDTLRGAIGELAPALLEGDAVWVGGDRGEGGGEGGGSEGMGGRELEDAFEWVARRHLALGNGGGRHAPGLVVVAGSLYLVADFYRLVNRTA